MAVLGGPIQRRKREDSQHQVRRKGLYLGHKESLIGCSLRFGEPSGLVSRATTDESNQTAGGQSSLGQLSLGLQFKK